MESHKEKRKIKHLVREINFGKENDEIKECNIEKILEGEHIKIKSQCYIIEYEDIIKPDHLIDHIKCKRIPNMWQIYICCVKKGTIVMFRGTKQICVCRKNINKLEYVNMKNNETSPPKIYHLTAWHYDRMSELFRIIQSVKYYEIESSKPSKYSKINRGEYTYVANLNDQIDNIEHRISDLEQTYESEFRKEILDLRHKYHKKDNKRNKMIQEEIAQKFSSNHQNNVKYIASLQSLSLQQTREIREMQGNQEKMQDVQNELLDTHKKISNNIKEIKFNIHGINAKQDVLENEQIKQARQMELLHQKFINLEQNISKKCSYSNNKDDCENLYSIEDYDLNPEADLSISTTADNILPPTNTLTTTTTTTTKVVNINRELNNSNVVINLQ